VGPKVKYITFEPDVGGWNNIRMQMESVLVMAAATGRTLVLPPDQPLYLLNKGKGHDNQHSFADFFPFDEIRKRVNVISIKEFFEREAVTGKLYRCNKIL
jgi:GDP-fucose protein O-fucosyltransferase